KLEQDFNLGKVEAIRAIGKLKGKDDQARAVIQIGIIIGGADGNFDPDEQRAGIDVNLTAFLVGANGKVRSDADMVFFNQPAGEGGSATYHPPAVQGSNVQHRLGFDLAR